MISIALFIDLHL